MIGLIHTCFFRRLVVIQTSLYLTTRILENKKFIQHGTTSVFTHCRNVALLSLKIARFFHIQIDENSLVRGALLHDYFLYDWHDKSSHKRWHGFHHPTTALNNASRDVELTSIEKDVIKHHMFPLTFSCPKTKEGWIVCMADKLCGIWETFKWNEIEFRHRCRSTSKNR